ncbi:PepSY domain-containing protein [Lachnospiraceae bacterium 54-11]
MKSLFSTPKKVIILVICAVVVIVAASVITVKSTLITKAEAMTVALRDADLSEAEASALRTRLEFDDGRFQYEVDFYNNGTEYEYLIQAKNGDIIARDIDGGRNSNNDVQGLPQDTGNQFASDENSSMQPQESVENQPDKEGDSTVQSQEVSPDGAKAAALKDAGLSESDVTFKKAELDYDHGTQIYDIEFYTSDTEYEYEIDASSGTVLEKNIEQFQIQTNPTNSAINSSDNNYIGVDRAKEIALNHAQLNESDVQFVKAKLENDDGGVEYEIEFYSGRTEYDYTIDAVSGNIIEYDVDYD